MKVRQRRFLQISVAVGIFAALLSEAPSQAQRPRVDPAPLASYTESQAAQGKTLYAQRLLENLR